MEIFVCHSSKDEDKAILLRNNLEEYYSLKVFCPNRELKAGHAYPEPLIQAIKDCDVFVIILTENFHGAAFTEQEVGIALAQKKPILPLKMDKTDPFGYIHTIQAVTPVGSIDRIPAMVQISTAIYDLLYPNKEEKRTIIIDNIKKTHDWNNQDSLARMLGIDKKYTKLQIAKLNYMLNNKPLAESGYTEQIIKKIVDFNPIDVKELESLIESLDNFKDK